MFNYLHASGGTFFGLQSDTELAPFRMILYDIKRYHKK